MGKKSHEVKPRTCLSCGKTFEVVSKWLRKHQKMCKP